MEHIYTFIQRATHTINYCVDVICFELFGLPPIDEVDEEEAEREEMMFLKLALALACIGAFYLYFF